MVKNKTRKVAYIDNELLSAVDEAMEKDNVESFSEFTNSALKFYLGFLNTAKTENYLLPTFRSMMIGEMSKLENRLAVLSRDTDVFVTINYLMMETLLKRWGCSESNEIVEDAIRIVNDYWENRKEVGC